MFTLYQMRKIFENKGKEIKSIMFEQRAIELALTKKPPVAPKSFLWYVDDSHALFNNLQSAIEFKTILNNQDPNIQYTMDAEDADKSLQFLDLKIQNAEREYVTSIY